eukprot:4215083-Alexandrium_andersonii.AAC.1
MYSCGAVVIAPSLCLHALGLEAWVNRHRACAISPTRRGRHSCHGTAGNKTVNKGTRLGANLVQDG